MGDWVESVTRLKNTAQRWYAKCVTMKAAFQEINWRFTIWSKRKYKTKSSKTNQILHMFKKPIGRQKMATLLSAPCLSLFSDTSLALTMIKSAPMLRMTALGNSWAEDTQGDRGGRRGYTLFPQELVTWPVVRNVLFPWERVPPSCFCISARGIYVSLCGNIRRLTHRKQKTS